jgi:DHA1 family bicyclomycin/chloramphenicol resistance-like MFS transporter
LNGFAMALTAFVMGGWLGTHMDGTIYPLIYGIWFWSALIALAAWTLVQKQGAPRAS